MRQATKEDLTTPNFFIWNIVKAKSFNTYEEIQEFIDSNLIRFSPELDIISMIDSNHSNLIEDPDCVSDYILYEKHDPYYDEQVRKHLLYDFCRNHTIFQYREELEEHYKKLLAIINI